MAGVTGIEPVPWESKSHVLPLHKTPMDKGAVVGWPVFFMCVHICLPTPDNTSPTVAHRWEVFGGSVVSAGFPLHTSSKDPWRKKFLQQYRKNTGISHPQMPIVCCVQVRAHNSHQRRPAELNRRVDFLPFLLEFSGFEPLYQTPLPPYIPAVCCRVLLFKELMFLLYRTYVLFSIRN